MPILPPPKISANVEVAAGLGGGEPVFPPPVGVPKTHTTTDATHERHHEHERRHHGHERPFKELWHKTL